MGRNCFRALPSCCARLGSGKMNESNSRLFNFLCALLCLFAASLGGMACQSTPTRAEAVRVVSDLDSVDAIIKGSSIPETQKKDALAKTEAAKKLVIEQAQALDAQAEKIDTLKKYRVIVWSVGIGLAMAIGAGLWYKFKPKLPL